MINCSLLNMHGDFISLQAKQKKTNNDKLNLNASILEEIFYLMSSISVSTCSILCPDVHSKITVVPWRKFFFKKMQRNTGWVYNLNLEWRKVGPDSLNAPKWLSGLPWHLWYSEVNSKLKPYICGPEQALAGQQGLVTQTTPVSRHWEPSWQTRPHSGSPHTSPGF